LVKDLINNAFKPALQIVERQWRRERQEGKARKDKKNAGTAALVIVGRLDQEKFFSNGAPDPDSFWESDFNPFLLGFDYPVSSRDPSFLTGGVHHVLLLLLSVLFKEHSDLRSAPATPTHIPKQVLHLQPSHVLRADGKSLRSTLQSRLSPPSMVTASPPPP
jgi:hypothetical protein